MEPADIDELIKILRSALGWGSNNPGYRNRYFVRVGTHAHALCTKMVSMGYMEAGKKSDAGAFQTFHATESGCSLAGLTTDQIKEALED